MTDMHAGESETSHTLVSSPDLVHLDRANQESGADLECAHLPNDVCMGSWWHACCPNHSSGDGGKANLELGEYDMKAWVADLTVATRAVKGEDRSLKPQNEFLEKAKHPFDTQQ
jgi:creatinine amidohydrolase